MNKIFKTKYDITTGQCKAVSELASNRQIASSSKSKPKCGGFWFLGMFKVLPLALLMSGMLGVSSVSYADIVYIDMDGETGAEGVNKDWSEAQFWKNTDSEHILLAPVQYSPTYAAGVGAIAIGSRSVAFGDASLAIGTLSFA
ncbi:hypothetical protein JFL60_03000 [Histophilus somni]|uniref:ESPR-type extended signal peptide-containing protein n=1 Tax=Histophilus somni TaxID=731 RepID=UPI0018EDF8F6|nr:ESPR-type extended signal peptide-containing protein [Histophilus somni]QQF66623.1 hypothetical protein JFL60_03000 [Histophilus somni]